jgi:succinyl-diaminopimelate desuccinylase
VADAIAAATNRRPALTTGGGTSDARFIKDLCPVMEFGLVGNHMHAVDERVPVAQIRALSRIYRDILRRFFR